MAEIQPEKMKGTTLDIAAENRARLKQLFPTVFTETRNDKGELTESIDFEKLKAELGTFSDTFESRRERYGMEWPGKKEALHLIQTLSSATLKPCRQESVNFDTTQNLFIEGDNLEVLKLLQTSYYGKVKMIYIDPPYNTGKEFIYPDNFSESLETYLEYAGLIDGEGKKFSTNTANEGRFHTKWLNMMYPRLYLARNLLRDDGVIFISIDDNEVSNLRKMCDEIFGEENFVGQFIINSSPSAIDYGHIGNTHEYAVFYAKNINDTETLPLEEEEKVFKYTDSKGGFNIYPLYNGNVAFNPQTRPNLYYPFYLDKKKVDANGFFEISLERKDSLIEVYPVVSRKDNIQRVWRWGKKKAQENLNDEIVGYKTEDGEYRVVQKTRLTGKIIRSLQIDTGISSRKGTGEVQEIFEKKVFSFPKPIELLRRFIAVSTEQDSIILDFFAGSATTAHAVLDLNKQDNGNRNFILVQLPEPCAPESEAFKAGYKTIADIGKERIRRVINKLNTEEEGKLDLDNAGKQDRGFKVLKLDKSNFRQWQKLEPSASPERILEQLSLHIDHIDAKATPEELLYEILLKAGFTLTGNIETKTITGKELFSVSDGALLLCLEESVTKELIDAVIELNPQQFLCLDSAFHGNDQLKANAVQTFNAHNMQKEKHNQILFKTV
jgi:adenine-specific DNA-methyltransferase